MIRNLIAITKEEKDMIHKRFPDIHIARTMKQDSKRHHYFCVEDRRAMRMLREMRGQTAPSGKRK